MRQLVFEINSKFKCFILLLNLVGVFVGLERIAFLLALFVVALKVFAVVICS